MADVPLLLRTRLPGALLALVLVATGCQGDSGDPTPPAGGGDTPAEPEPAPPGPAERLGLTPGWGPSERELDDAVRAVKRLPLPAATRMAALRIWGGMRGGGRHVNGRRMAWRRQSVFSSKPASAAAPPATTNGAPAKWTGSRPATEGATS